MTSNYDVGQVGRTQRPLHALVPANISNAPRRASTLSGLGRVQGLNTTIIENFDNGIDERTLL